MPGAHTQAKPAKRRSLRIIGLVLCIVVVGGGVAFVMNGKSTGTTESAAPPVVAHETASTRPLNLVSITPANGASGVASNATVTVQLSEPLSANTPMPTLTPAVAGTWQQLSPTTLAFVAAAPLVPSSTETVTVPAGLGGVESAGGITLAEQATSHFTVAPGSTLRLQQLLAQQGYLPVGFTPAGPVVAPQELAQPQEGTFTWRFTEPDALVSQWTAGSGNVITKAAVMSFESKHDMESDGIAGPGVWGKLLADAAAGTVNADSYNYVYVSKSLPQKATVYSNGAAVYSTPANLGITGAETASGTFPVFEHLKLTRMRGTNPDGTKYDDPDIPWVSYFNGGDALHGFVRSSYGYPQSVGCVELPPANAAVVFPYTPVGTLVTVS